MQLFGLAKHRDEYAGPTNQVSIVRFQELSWSVDHSANLEDTNDILDD